MKLHVEVSKIKCNRTTAELSKDEVYGALTFFSGTKVDGDFVPDKRTKKIYVTDVQTGVKGGDIWKPTPNRFTFDLGETDHFGLQFSLYEKDNAKAYEKLRAQSQVEEADFGTLLSKIPFPTSMTSAATASVPLVETVINLYNFLRNDDMIGSEPFAYHIDDPKLEMGKSFKFKRLFANYDIVLNFELERKVQN